MRFTSLLFFLLALGAPAFAQAPPADACLIVKHKGTVGRRLIWWALIGIPIAPGAKYDYVDNIDFRSAKLKYGGKELEGIQQSGVHVIVLNGGFRAEDLDAARRACNGTETQGVRPDVAVAAPPAASRQVEVISAVSTPAPVAGDAVLGLSGVGVEDGFKVTAVQASSPAARIFLKPGDLISQINGREVRSAQDIRDAIAASKGDTAKVSFLFQTNLGTMPSEKQIALR